MDNADHYWLAQEQERRNRQEYDSIIVSTRAELAREIVSDLGMAFVKLYMARSARVTQCWLTDRDVANLVVERFPQYAPGEVEASFQRFCVAATPPAGCAVKDAGKMLVAAWDDVAKTFNLRPKKH